jgi:DNA polymerase III alpha subunit (gram-positive type)
MTIGSTRWLILIAAGATATGSNVAKGGKSFCNTEFFAFAGDKINRIDVYFGAGYQNGAFVKQGET